MLPRVILLVWVSSGAVLRQQSGLNAQQILVHSDHLCVGQGGQGLFRHVGHVGAEEKRLKRPRNQISYSGLSQR